MTSRGDLEPFSDSLDQVFARLGLPDPIVISQIAGQWDEMAGNPWSGRSKPLYVRDQILVVEASAASMVAFLRYGEKSLLETLSERFGEGVVIRIEVIPPKDR